MQRGFTHLLLVMIVVLVIAAVGGYILWQNKANPTAPGGLKACTADAMVCPDGSSVGRTGPNCEFAACPSVQPSATASGSADTADWKAYLNKTYGYSISYPATHFVMGDDFELATPNSLIVSILKGTANELEKYNSEANDREALYYDSLSIYVSKSGPCTAEKVPGAADIQIDGTQSTKLTGKNPLFADPFYGDVVIYTTKNDMCYELIYLRDPKNLQTSEKQLIQFLSTFKFN